MFTWTKPGSNFRNLHNQSKKWKKQESFTDPFTFCLSHSHHTPVLELFKASRLFDEEYGVFSKELSDLTDHSKPILHFQPRDLSDFWRGQNGPPLNISVV